MKSTRLNNCARQKHCAESSDHGYRQLFFMNSSASHAFPRHLHNPHQSMPALLHLHIFHGTFSVEVSTCIACPEPGSCASGWCLNRHTGTVMPANFCLINNGNCLHGPMRYQGVQIESLSLNLYPLAVQSGMAAVLMIEHAESRLSKSSFPTVCMMNIFHRVSANLCSQQYTR